MFPSLFVYFLDLSFYALMITSCLLLFFFPRSKSSKTGFQAWLPLPLPKQLVVFGLGDWSCYSPNTSIVADVLVSPGITPQRVGTLEPTRRSRQELVLPGCQQGCPGKAFCSVVLPSSAGVIPKLIRPAGPLPWCFSLVMLSASFWLLSGLDLFWLWGVTS